MATAPSLSMPQPPPVGGWDTRESLADMPIESAIILDNWFPETDKVQVRRGYTEHATGMSGSVESLIEYIPTTGVGQLFAANGASIYNVSTGGAVGAAVVTGLSNAKFQYTQMGTAANQFVFLVNGADAPRLYNGTAWTTTPAITGPTVDNLDLVQCALEPALDWRGRFTQCMVSAR